MTPEKRPDAENTLVWTPLEKPVRDSKFKKGNPGKVYIPVLECALCGQPKRFESKKPVASHGAMCGFCWNRSFGGSLDPCFLRNAIFSPEASLACRSFWQLDDLTTA